MSNRVDETNYRTIARQIVEKYDQKGMIIDALLWGEVLRHYENALRKANILEGKAPCP